MKLQRTLAAIGVALSLSVFGPLASAATSAIPISAAQVSGAETRSPHASLHLDVGHGKAWLGQSIPVTLRAYFRNVEGVTLEGAPQITSGGVFTSDLAREPHQSTEIIGGEPVLVATWSGTLTPSTAGPLALNGELPVRVRYRDAAPQAPRSMMMDEDAFQALAANPFDRSALDRLFEGDSAPQGRLHEEVTTLRSVAPALDVLPLPTEGQPPTFSGAVGRFSLQASVSTPTAHVSEPVTLRVTVDGSGDFDRVDLHGVDTSDTWKTYPMSAKSEPASDGKTPQHKVFEQVLVPLRGGGAQTIPPISLASFDPKTGHYETRSTAPITLPVDGTAAPATTATPQDIAGATATAAPAKGTAPIDEEAAAHALEAPEYVHFSTVLLAVAPALVLLSGFAAATAWRKRRAAGALAEKMRHAAARGTAAPFYQAAHDLIATRLSEKWGLAPSDVTTDVIHHRLGLEGDLFVDTFATDEALRFGRATVQMEQADLRPLCSSIERSLSSVSSLGGVS